MARAQVYDVTAFEDSGITLMARVVGHDASNITQAGISAIEYSVIDKSDNSLIVNGAALAKTTVIFDSLQTDARWTIDSTGYNFRHALPASALPDGNATYRVEYKITPTSGDVFHMAFDVETLSLLAS